MEPRQAILVVSFGTSYNDSREKTIGAVERAVAEAFPAYECAGHLPARGSLIN